ncbi:MAG: putative toxin-antitoxin system toxin component, PIN family [Steroidobacterales bacterium]
MRDMTRVRCVLDTNVLVAAVRSRVGASSALLRETASDLLPIVSTSLWLEYEAVLKRREQLRTCGWTADQVDEFLGRLAERCEPVELHFRWRPQMRDPKDEMVLDTALNGRAGFLVTHDSADFLPLRRKFAIEIVTPARMLAIIRGHHE